MFAMGTVFPVADTVKGGRIVIRFNLWRPTPVSSSHASSMVLLSSEIRTTISSIETCGLTSLDSSDSLSVLSKVVTVILDTPFDGSPGCRVLGEAVARLFPIVALLDFVVHEKFR